MEENNKENLIENTEEIIEEKKFRRSNIIKIVSLSILTLFVIAIFSFILQFRIRYIAKVVQGHSMLPTLNELTETENESGDMVYVNTYAKIKQGDIVVISSKELKEDIIKRCIAVGGQTVNITGENATGFAYISTGNHVSIKITLYEEYYVEVDGQRLNESYILNADNKSVMEKEYEYFCIWKYNNGYKTNYEGAIKLSDDEIFALGDNRTGSTDSATVGPFTTSEIVGRVDFIVKYKTSFIEECLQKLSFIFIIKK